MNRLWPIAALAVLLPSLSAQERTVAPGFTPARPSVPTPPASALDAAAQRVDPSQLRPGIDGGQPATFPALLDDEAPLPIPRQVRPGPDGDVVVAPASGDPYFLGFMAGPYYPPQGERIDPLLLASVQTAYTDGRPNRETYAFVMFEKRITQARIDALEALGARVLDFHPHNCMKIALPIFSIESLAASPDVHWIGMARPAQKLHPRLLERLALAGPGELIDVYVNVFDSDLNGQSTVETFGSVSQLTGGVVEPGDPAALPSRTQSNGWQQRGLQQLGVEVREYVETTRAFRARLSASQVESVVALDYVLFVESDEAHALHHDFSTPLIASDNVRPYASGGTNLVVTSAQVDSGFDANHWDLNHTNGVGWDLSSSGTGPWHDGCEHGSHVAGTMLGNGGSGLYEVTGNAPGLGWGGSGRHYNVKIFNNSCGDGGASMASIINLLKVAYLDGGGATTQRPMVVQNSWGSAAGSTPYNGCENDARLLDDEVYFRVQDYVFSTGNSGANKVGLQAGSKNVLSVGSVQAYSALGYGSIGDLAWDSSYGPMGDTRWKPNVVAPGVDIFSVDANTTTGHTYKSGTSMAAPHVSGVLAQLLDAYSWLRYSPSRADCLVMASAVTRNNQLLSTPSDTHLRQFGTGRVDATKAMWGTGDSSWTNWGTFLSSNTYMYGDFTVNPGCTRLVVCMHYKESQAPSGATVALKNNWDLYLDQAPIDPNFNTGDWFAQQSTRDNTEIRILDNPQTGAWRWKTWPTSTTTGSDMSVTVYAYYATTTPDLTVTTTQSHYYARPYQTVDFTGWVYNPASLASGVVIWPTLDGAVLIDSLRSLADGTTAHFTNNWPSWGNVVTLGDMFPAQWKGNIWQVQWQTEGIKNLIVASESDNATDHNAFAQVVVDGTPPSDVTGLGSTHPAFTWTNSGDVSTWWNAATDALSGVAGYSLALTTGGATYPDTTVETSGTTFDFYGTPSSPPGGYYISVIAVDNSGNASSNIAALGPLFIDVDDPTGPTSVISTSHVLGNSSCSTTISMQWNNGSDGHSGVHGYATSFDHSPGTSMTGAPVNIVGLGNPYISQNVGASASPWYFHIATADWAGNYSATTTVGPYFTSATPTAYCVAKLNALGCYPDIGYSGSASASATSGFTVYATEVRNNKPGLVIYSVTGAASTPFQGGTMCVAAPVRRSTGVGSGGAPTGNDCSGMYALDMNSFAHGLLGGNPHASLLVAGTNVWCQWWGRDPGFPAPNNSTLSNALNYTVCN